ncbi:MAG: 16S rRNA (guanine(966)-N(2))-methyltransferase RsmD [Aestuariivita sp.]|nr:16S rRNA (guanine(966)-N(2))-methyltransferase RsmD [Aestuariivita sp.]MCY4345473.1 16S rRNA (guanine(966)-N(2))-methyltransferase RsmD [Aestuariivita sp.]
MRIIAGEFRGRKLASVKSHSLALRPTRDRVRESVFNILQSQQTIHGTRILDIFAGTGAMGLEAISRGADSAIFVENSRESRRLLRENISTLQLEVRSRIIAEDATRLGANDTDPTSIVFLDPPYGKGLGLAALSALTTGGWLSADALIVWEESTHMSAPPSFATVDHRKYGASHITLMRYLPCV